MSVHSFDDLDAHWEHEIELVRYGVKGDGTDPRVLAVAIECVPCRETLIEFAREERR